MYKGERIAIKELSDHTDIMITKTHKRGAVVIMDLKDSIKETHHQLNNKDHYKIFNKEPTTTNTKLVNDTIQRLKKKEITYRKNCRWLESVKPQNFQILYAAKSS